MDATALRGAALEAAIDDSRWPALIEPLLADFDSVGALLAVADRRSGAMVHGGMIGFDVDIDGFWCEYFGDKGVDDTQVHRVMASRGPHIFADGDHVDMDDPRHVGFIGWQEARLGSRHHLTFADDVTPDLIVGLALHRSRTAGHAASADRARLALLQRILTPALRLGLTHAEALTESWWEGAVLRSGDMAAMLDEHGRVIRLTAGFEEQLREASFLRLSGARLHAAAPEAGHALDRLVSEAVSQRSLSPGALALPGTKGGRLALTIYPLSFEQRFLAGYRAAALVFLVDAGRHSADETLLQGAFALTPREAHIAARLATGHDLGEIAADLSISRETARVHLRNIFAKTGTNRQSALVRLVSLVGR